MNDVQKKFHQPLIEGAAQMGVSLSDVQVQHLLAYIEEFDKWNKAYNLSAIRDPQQMISRHLLDSLSVVPQVSESKAVRIIDVGTGGGLPGIPLAIMFPKRQFTLLDSNGKKTRFLFHVKNQLHLANVQIENRRVEAFQPAQKFQAVISRAFASLADMVSGCAHLLADDGVFMAMKGIYPAEELAQLADLCQLLASHPLQVPGEEGARHLLVLAPRTR